MMRFISSLGVAAVLLGAMSSPLLARGNAGHAGHPAGAAVRVAGFHGLHHGPGGYLYRDYRGWGGYYWNARYRCNFFYCPQASCYYYWYAPSACYLPASQIATYPPTVTVVNNVNVNTAAPTPPPGLPIMPPSATSVMP